MSPASSTKTGPAGAPPPVIASDVTHALLRFLLSPEAHGAGTGTPVLVETHMSWVVLDARVVLKLKKPVCHPPLHDLRSLCAREREARAELRLNRRLAPGVYLGVLQARSDGEHFVLRPDGAPAEAGAWHTVDWIVQMRRLPDERMLDRVIAAGAALPGDIDALALVLSRFYGAAMPAAIEPHEHLGKLRVEQQRNRDVLSRPEFGLAGAVAALDAHAGAIEREAGILGQRVRQGRIVDGHGDLRPEHVCLLDPPVVIDALTLDDALRQVDPFEELVGLGQDCERLGAPWIGPLLLARCAERLDDAPDPSLLRLYAANRAMLRARLAVAHLLDAAPSEPQRWLERGRLHVAQGWAALA